jgi:uncharacterized protein YprB with RNaseH-like and TPR domain
MADLQEQLALLRRRVARIDRKYENGPPVCPPHPKPERFHIEEWSNGQVVDTAFGRHFETERIWERHRRHGSMDISQLAELPADLLDAISEGEVSACKPERWAFLDTETTGLAGGTGTCAFLIGVGRITPDGFRLRQFFMRDYGEEASVLDALARHLSEFELLVTYNGKVYDQPLLETRYRLARSRPPFSRVQHFDLLYGARRLWKLRLDSCRLVDLENQILGVEREGDLPGEMIPYVYFEYLRTKEAFKLQPIFHHNAIDILTLACLTAIVPWAFQSPEGAPLAHGADMVGIARWLRRAGRLEDALLLFRRAVDRGLPDSLLFRTLWDVAALEKKCGRDHAALAVFTELAAGLNPFRTPALEELSKHYEHREKNYAMALEFVRAAIDVRETDSLRHRERRLLARLASRRAAARLV